MALGKPCGIEGVWMCVCVCVCVCVCGALGQGRLQLPGKDVSNYVKLAGRTRFSSATLISSEKSIFPPYSSSSLKRTTNKETYALYVVNTVSEPAYKLIHNVIKV